MQIISSLQSLGEAWAHRIKTDIALATGRPCSSLSFSTEHIHNPYSDVLKISATSGSEREIFFLKIPRKTPENLHLLATRLQNEFDIMSRLAAKWQEDSRYGVANSVAFYPELPALLTAEAAGQPLTRCYRTIARRFPARSEKELLQAVFHCGAWLREFQKLTESHTASFDSGELINYCEIRFRLLSENPRYSFSKNLEQSLVNQVRLLSEATPGNEIRFCGRHNDFASHNIIIQGDAIRIIDFSMYDTGASTYDVCNFWLELEMLKCDWTLSRKFLGALQLNFLSGYGETPSDAYSRAFALARLRYTLNRLLTALDSLHSWKLGTHYRRRVASACREWLDEFARGKSLSTPV